MDSNKIIFTMYFGVVENKYLNLWQYVYRQKLIKIISYVLLFIVLVEIVEIVEIVPEWLRFYLFCYN